MAKRTVEFLSVKQPSAAAVPMLEALRKAAVRCGDVVKLTSRYEGRSDWLVLFGVGYGPHNEARNRQLLRGGHAALLDLGYFGKSKDGLGYSRVSVDQDHPQHLLERAPADATRWTSHGLALREDADPAGPIVLVGLGRKSREYLKAGDWEQRKLAELEARLPGRRILHRPKPRQEFSRLHCDRDVKTPIAQLLRGASLVVCRHSNVAIDAAVAGVPIEVEDGAAQWLASRAFTHPNRLEFLQRVSWFQWRPSEAPAAWQFIKGLG